MTQVQRSETPLCQKPDWAAQLAAYGVPPILIVTAMLYLIAAVMDEFNMAGYKLVYIVGAAAWVLGQILFAIALPVMRTDDCSKSI